MGGRHVIREQYRCVDPAVRLIWKVIRVEAPDEVHHLTIHEGVLMHFMMRRPGISVDRSWEPMDIEMYENLLVASVNPSVSIELHSPC